MSKYGAKRTVSHRRKPPTAREDAEQSALFEWAEWSENMHPELALMLHIPNGGHRHKATAVRLKREGVKAGVPDIYLPVPRGAYAGLWIELKSAKGSLSELQRWWVARLRGQGYAVGVCYGWEQARDAIVEYLSGAKWDTFRQDLAEWVAWKRNLTKN